MVEWWGTGGLISLMGAKEDEKLLQVRCSSGGLRGGFYPVSILGSYQAQALALA